MQNRIKITSIFLLALFALAACGPSEQNSEDQGQAPAQEQAPAEDTTTN